MESDRYQNSQVLYPGSPEAAFQEAETTARMMFPQIDLGPVQRVSADTVKLFNGEWPGYRSCNTEYHNLDHTAAGLLTLTRLVHGAVLQGVGFTRREAVIGMISALLHDTGYIQTVADTSGTGAKYTLVHIQRSIRFMEEYLPKVGFTLEDCENCRDVLSCTGLSMKIDEIHFKSEKTEMLGRMLGAADLIGQLADRAYLEKLLFLFYEFREGQVGDYDTELDLLRRTASFYDVTRERLAKELGGVDKYMIYHFRERWDMDRDLYQEAISKNRTYLQYILENHEAEHRDYLRRGGVVRRLAEQGL